MRLIQTFFAKDLPLQFGWKKEFSAICSVYLSAALLRKHYGGAVTYVCDNLGARTLIDWGISEQQVIPLLTEGYCFENYWTLSKLIAYDNYACSQVFNKYEPFLHVDLDFFMFKPVEFSLNKWKVQSKSPQNLE